MTEFDYDVRERKRLAAGARKKRNGSRSRYVCLPNDHLSERQKNKMNGEVKVYKIGRPITYKELKGYNNEMRRKYLEWIRDNFNVSSGTIAEMLGTPVGTFWAFRHDNGLLDIEFPRATKKSEMELFRKWQCSEPETVPAAADTPKKEKKVPPLVDPEFVNTLVSGQIELVGKASQIGQTLFRIFQDTKLRMNISFFVLTEENPDPPQEEHTEENT